MNFREWFIEEGVKWPPQPYRGYNSTICDQDYLAKLASKSPYCIVDKSSGKGSHWSVYKRTTAGAQRITTIPSNVSPKWCSDIYNAIAANCG